MSTEQQITPQEDGFKVFAGNLAFATKDDDLKALFAPAGNVTNAVVINRGTRSLGYGFVTFATEAEAQAAVSQLDKKEVEGRTINVELAKPGSGPRPPRERKAREPKPRKTDEELVNGDGEVLELGEGGEVKAKKKRAKKSKAKKPKADGEVSEAADALAATQLEDTAPEATPAAKKPRAPRSKKPKDPNAVPGLRRGPPTGEPSKTLLFVANLAFAVDDAALKDVFSAYNVTSARVVTKKVGPSEGRSKGFGFVDFASEEEQQKALSEVQGKEVEGRAVQLKVAVSPAENKEEAPAAEVAAEASA